HGDENAEVRCGRGQIVGVIVRQLRADVERLDPFLAAKRRPSHEANLGHGCAAVRVLDRLRLTQVLLVGLQSYEMKASYLVSDISGAPSRPGLQSPLCQSWRGLPNRPAVNLTPLSLPPGQLPHLDRP